jgi:hypothetical protein
LQLVSVFKEVNAIAATNLIQVSNVKMILTEMMTLAGVLIVYTGLRSAGSKTLPPIAPTCLCPSRRSVRYRRSYPAQYTRRRTFSAVRNRVVTKVSRKTVDDCVLLVFIVHNAESITLDWPKLV